MELGAGIGHEPTWQRRVATAVSSGLIVAGLALLATSALTAWGLLPSSWSFSAAGTFVEEIAGADAGAAEYSGVPLTSATLVEQLAAIESAMAEEAAPLAEDERPAAPTVPSAPASQRIVIPRIGVNSAVVEVALTGGEWPVPKFAVGRLVETARPGELGNAVFAGHLQSLTSGNVFARLKELAVGDEVRFTTVGGERVFRVIESKLVRNTDASVLAGQHGKATVTLITCEGKWIPWENDYDQRRIVVAELVKASPDG